MTSISNAVSVPTKWFAVLVVGMALLAITNIAAFAVVISNSNEINQLLTSGKTAAAKTGKKTAENVDQLVKDVAEVKFLVNYVKAAQKNSAKDTQQSLDLIEGVVHRELQATVRAAEKHLRLVFRDVVNSEVKYALSQAAKIPPP